VKQLMLVNLLICRRFTIKLSCANIFG
jgi:hypothetical protein